MLHHLTSLYIKESSYSFYLQLYEEALCYLTKAEENLVHIDQGKNNSQVEIFNNRIIMLIKMKRLLEAEQEVKRFAKFLKKQPDLIPGFQTLIELYQADVALCKKSFSKLAENICHLKQMEKTEDQIYALRFMKARLDFIIKILRKQKKSARLSCFF